MHINETIWILHLFIDNVGYIELINKPSNNKTVRCYEYSYPNNELFVIVFQFNYVKPIKPSGQNTRY